MAALTLTADNAVMPPIKPHILRAVANDQLERIFPGQIPAAREELVTSVMRQWATHDGNAGVFTLVAHYWLTVALVEGKVHAGAEVVPDELKRHLATWQIVDRDLQRVLWDLSVVQSATFINAEGLTVRVWVEVPQHVFRYEEVPDADD